MHVVLYYMYVPRVHVISLYKIDSQKYPVCNKKMPGCFSLAKNFCVLHVDASSFKATSKPGACVSSFVLEK
jgi:hypothetical protein